MKLKFLLYLFTAIMWIFLPAKIFAQEENLHLVTVPYKSLQDLRFLTSQSIHALDTIKQEDVFDPPLFLAITNEEQEKEIIRYGFPVNVIDQNAGDIKQYYLFEGDQTLQFPSYIGFEMVYPFTYNLTLVKLSEGRSLDELPTAEINKYYVRQYITDMKLPEILDTTPTPTLTPIPVKNISGSDTLSQFFVLVLMMGTLGGGNLLFYKKKKSCPRRFFNY